MGSKFEEVYQQVKSEKIDEKSTGKNRDTRIDEKSGREDLALDAEYWSKKWFDENKFEIVEHLVNSIRSDDTSWNADELRELFDKAVNNAIQGAKEKTLSNMVRYHTKKVIQDYNTEEFERLKS